MHYNSNELVKKKKKVLSIVSKLNWLLRLPHLKILQLLDLSIALPQRLKEES